MFEAAEVVVVAAIKMTSRKDPRASQLVRQIGGRAVHFAGHGRFGLV